MKPHQHLFRLAALAAALAVPVLAGPAAAEKPLPPAFGTELKPEFKSREASEPTGAAELEDRPKKRSKDEDGAAVIRKAGRGARGGRVKIQLDGDEDGGGSGEFGSDAGSDPDAGDF
jgi:hypothetical protein